MEVLPYVCTGTLISERYVITNYHCVYPSKKYQGREVSIANIRMYMNYHRPNTGRDAAEVKEFALFSSPVEYSADFDYAILEVAGSSPASEFGYVPVRFGDYSSSDSLFIIHHSADPSFGNSMSDHKRITFRDCQPLNFSNIGTIPVIMPDGKSQRAAVEGRDVPHFCDTTGGSSGSLVFNANGDIVGLHFAGLRNKDAPENSRFNLFINIRAILSQSHKLREIGYVADAPPATPTPPAPTPPAPTPVAPVRPPSQPSAALITTSEELVRRAAQGGRLELAAVTFRLSAPLELRGDVQLIGQGYERTRIVSSAPEAVVRYRGGGTFTARGVGFVRDGGEGDVVHVADGNVAMDACQFMGGVWLNDNDYRGAGIALKGNSRGTIRNSQANNNYQGIFVSDSAQPQLEQNRIYENDAGILYLYKDSAAGSAVGNEIFANGWGISVGGDAKPQLEQNRIYDNQASGIYYSESAAGSASNNQIYNNGLNSILVGAGITLQDSANPTLSNNTFYGNRRGAIQDWR